MQPQLGDPAGQADAPPNVREPDTLKTMSGVVMDEALVQRRAKVRGTMVGRALGEGRVVAES